MKKAQIVEFWVLGLSGWVFQTGLLISCSDKICPEETKVLLVPSHEGLGFGIFRKQDDGSLKLTYGDTRFFPFSLENRHKVIEEVDMSDTLIDDISNLAKCLAQTKYLTETVKDLIGHKTHAPAPSN